MRVKYGNLDKYDCHMPGKKSFIQDAWYVSKNHENLHITCGYIVQGNADRGTRFGINRKAWKASPAGIMVDGHYVGKPETL